MSSRNYSINFIRILCTCAILLYHLGLIKGGYLAVCTFFVLSGYLSTVSSLKKDDFSILSYYKNRIKKIYFPLIIITFVVVGILSFFDNIYWFNLKPETTSIIFGYNNFWQRTVNLDYFARHIDSPFMHLWYISILMQYELIFPILFKILKKIGNKIKSLPCIILFLLFIISSIYFYKINIIKGINYAYYDTFGRSFSFFLGMFIGFINYYYKSYIINNKIYYLYLFVLSMLFIFVPYSSKYYSIIMILVSILSGRLIEYGLINNYKNKFFINFSYEIYLIQYPVIFIFQNINIPFKIIIIILLIILLSWIYHYIIYETKNKVIRNIFCLILIIFSLYGFLIYIKAKDYTKEMNILKEQLSNNEKELEKNNQKYLENLKQEEENWIKKLETYENYEEKLKDVVKNLPVVGIGDSVMLGAVNNLYQKFPNGYFDAKISRTAWSCSKILTNLKNNNKLGNPIIIHLGTNGDCSTSCKDEILEVIGDKDVYLINTTNLEYVNNNLSKYASLHDNVYLIDWKNISSGHKEYFYADGIHLTPAGRKAYSEAIYKAIYDNYLIKYEKMKNDLIKEYENKKNNKISFYGNSLLLNAFDYISKDFKDSNFVINSFENIINTLKNENSTKRCVFIFNNLTLNDYNTLVKLCNNQIYIFNINGKLNKENVYNFELKNEYLMPDGKHLNEKGNKALSEFIKNNVKG